MPIQALPPLAAQDVQHAAGLVAAPLWASLRGERIFLTGGTGFVGKWLLASLIEADRTLRLGCEVVVLSRDPRAFEQQVPDLATARGVRLVTGDVRDFTFADGHFDRVIHAATDVVAHSTPLQTFDTCVTGTRHVLEFAAKAGSRDFLLVSSGAMYGRQPPELHGIPESHIGAPSPGLPETAYGQGKRAAEWLTNAFAAEHGLRAVTARLFAFVGPYLALDKHFAIGNFLRDAMAGKPIVVQGDGTPFRSYLYAADMAGWLWNILFRGTAGAAYNVGDEEGVSIAELAQRIAVVTGSTGGVSMQGGLTTNKLPERYVPDISRARNELGLRRVITLEDGLRRTAQWHQSAAVGARRL